MFELKTVLLFLITAVAEIVGCYLPYLWLKEGNSVWLLAPAALSLDSDTLLGGPNSGLCRLTPGL